MAQRTYVRAHAAISKLQLDSLIDSATGLVGCSSSADADTIYVDHPSLAANHDAAIQGVLDTYTFDPDSGVSDELMRLRVLYGQLLTYAEGAEAVDTGWTGTTYNATKDGQNRVLYRRLALICRGIRDLMFVLDRQAG